MLKRILAVMALAIVPLQAQAFCGFYVGKADSSLFNESSQVILARDGQRTTISMHNDYRGELTEFALVVPVPVVLRKEDVKVLDQKVFERLDSYTAPRLVEYHDEDPCSPRERVAMMSAIPAPTSVPRGSQDQRVRVEVFFTVGEYDIVILSAQESDALEAWLTQHGYNIPRGASAALRPYVRQDMKFFVARVNLKEHAKGGSRYLSPLQFGFTSDKFMLPMRLGMLNAKGPQDLIVYTLTRKGRVEASNYRTVKMPTGVDLPIYVRDPAVFRDFYKTMFARLAEEDRFRTVFTEYAWDSAWCDPCAAPPPRDEEIVAAGATWVADGTSTRRRGASVAVTRLHLRYTPDSFPEDLMLQETADRATFQARYVLRHPWTGNPYKCGAALGYFAQLGEREDQEARALARLTGWNLAEIRARLPRRSTPIPLPATP
ncbi:MAG: DUF2330 domain-containing protein [Reyranella sp.]|uniref:DUF2330 domain-containing protein n=1 Tax=Reyranella sp. TaxID=1929291 RepID=UPI003D11ED36